MNKSDKSSSNIIKESWTRKEVIELFNSFVSYVEKQDYDAYWLQFAAENWLEENLK